MNAENELANELRRLRVKAGAPSARRISAYIGVSHTTITNVFNGSRPPSENTVRQLARYLHGNEAQLIQMWRAARAEAAVKDSEPVRRITVGELIDRLDSIDVTLAAMLTLLDNVDRALTALLQWTTEAGEGGQ